MRYDERISFIFYSNTNYQRYPKVPPKAAKTTLDVNKLPNTPFSVTPNTLQIDFIISFVTLFIVYIRNFVC